MTDVREASACDMCEACGMRHPSEVVSVWVKRKVGCVCVCCLRAYAVSTALLRVEGVGFRVLTLRTPQRVEGLGFRVSGVGFRV